MVLTGMITWLCDLARTGEAAARGGVEWFQRRGPHLVQYRKAIWAAVSWVV
jgi:hypothetical protein